jgi:hypothetical protein
VFIWQIAILIVKMFMITLQQYIMNILIAAFEKAKCPWLMLEITMQKGRKTWLLYLEPTQVKPLTGLDWPT